MYSTKKQVQQVVASLKAYGIDRVILSPGSRNAPLIQTFSNHPYFHCHLIVDERSAAFFALGLIQKLKRPVAICCTSGTALLNYTPAIAEAYYQQLPLIVISADRSQAWIGQMDGQTIPQAYYFEKTIKKSVNLPEVKDKEDEWYAQRLIHEAILAASSEGKGPVHINVPIAEPLFDFSVKELPDIRSITKSLAQLLEINNYKTKWDNAQKRMIVVGQLLPNNALSDKLEELAQHTDCIILCEHLSNLKTDTTIGNFDPLIHQLNDVEKDTFAPDLLITLGGHIVSKKLKQYLRQYKPQEHWHISESGELIDLYQSLTDLIQCDGANFIEQLTKSYLETENKAYRQLWQTKSDELPEPNIEEILSDISAVGLLLKHLPENSSLFLANSSPLRNAQLFRLNKATDVYCNRGTNGIDGTLSTAAGLASINEDPTFLIVGDLSFFYDLGALWNNLLPKNLHILLINNGGGGIFHQLPGLNQANSLEKYVAAGHNQQAKMWAQAANLEYISVDSITELKEKMSLFCQTSSEKPILMEVHTSTEISLEVIKEYYNNHKNR